MKLRPILDGENLIGYMFFCPGCKEPHSYFTVKLKPESPVWNFNGNLESPTFSPSLIYRHLRLCHLFLTDGQLHFLADCHHELKSTTVPLAEWPEGWR